MKNSAIIETYLDIYNIEASSYYTYTGTFCMYDTLVFAFDNLSDISPSITLIRTNE